MRRAGKKGTQSILGVLFSFIGNYMQNIYMHNGTDPLQRFDKDNYYTRLRNVCIIFYYIR